MAWDEERSRDRIREFRARQPTVSITVEDFQSYFSERRPSISKALLENSAARTDPILNLPYNKAVNTVGVHVYASLLEFDNQLTDTLRETEASHERALQFLHVHYGACDRLIAAFGIQRVDFHGHRLHAVVLTPEGANHAKTRALKAVAFANAFLQLVVRQAELFGGRFRTGVAIGIDSGPAVAINSGRGSEPEPLFVGSPANHAARLARNSAHGIYLSARVKRELSAAPTTPFSDDDLPSNQISILNEEVRKLDIRDAVSGASLIERAREVSDVYFEGLRSIPSSASGPVSFTFHTHRVPLSTLRFDDHYPSNSVRMGMSSIFADLDGFTAYIDNAIRTGGIAEAVANLHTIRAEFAACLKNDFGGKKIRFVGDCLHAVTSKGSDDKETAIDAIVIAGALRSSFLVLQSELPNIRGLDLAIGLEFGPTPITRIGLRGESSVRCSASKATCNSENMQRDCDKNETKIGERLRGLIPFRVANAFGMDGKISGLDYQTALLITGSSSSAPTPSAAGPLRAHSGLRAHSF